MVSAIYLGNSWEDSSNSDKERISLSKVTLFLKTTGSVTSVETFNGDSAKIKYHPGSVLPAVFTICEVRDRLSKHHLNEY